MPLAMPKYAIRGTLEHGHRFCVRPPKVLARIVDAGARNPEMVLVDDQTYLTQVLRERFHHGYRNC